ncbi:MAG: hypothetical protein Q6365_015680 [Candidatus Sigynarchaeota archaeon]
MEVIQTCRHHLARREIYQLLGDDRQVISLTREPGPGDAFTPAEQAVIDALRASTAGSFVHHQATGAVFACPGGSDDVPCRGPLVPIAFTPAVADVNAAIASLMKKGLIVVKRRIRDVAARLLVPLPPRLPGDDFVPPGLATLSPDEQALMRLLQKCGSRTFVHDPSRGTLKVEFVLRTRESPPPARFSLLPTEGLALNDAIAGLVSKRLLTSRVLGGPSWHEVKLVDW